MQKGDRNRLIKLIHVARRELQIDDDSYRMMLSNMPVLKGKTSAKDCTVLQLNSILEQLKNRGFKVRKAVKTRALASDEQSRKIRSLWLELHASNVVRDSSEKALAAYVMRICKIEALQWLSSKQAGDVIETLKKWLQRSSKKTQEV